MRIFDEQFCEAQRKFEKNKAEKVGLARTLWLLREG